MSARDPEAILAELGRDLHSAWRRPSRRVRLVGWRRGAVLVLATLALVPTAVGTRDAIWAPEPARLPDASRPPGSVAPKRAGEQVYVAAGTTDGIAWRLSASACDYGSLRAVGVFLTVPGGGGGARCDVASTHPGAGVTPRALAQRLVQTYYDPVSGRTWAFGALPAATRSVEVAATGASVTVSATAADERAVAKGQLPSGMRVFVAVLPGARDVPLVTARDASGAVLLVCREGRCADPTTKETP
jgi:hypothetical protein